MPHLVSNQEPPESKSGVLPIAPWGKVEGKLVTWDGSSYKLITQAFRPSYSLIVIMSRMFNISLHYSATSGLDTSGQSGVPSGSNRAVIPL